jgi:tetratricopeptide (TPR) repeat protein
MRQSFSRPTIYVIVGLGLFVFAISQWKRDSASESTYDISQPLTTLRDESRLPVDGQAASSQLIAVDQSPSSSDLKGSVGQRQSNELLAAAIAKGLPPMDVEVIQASSDDESYDLSVGIGSEIGFASLPEKADRSEPAIRLDQEFVTPGDDEISMAVVLPTEQAVPADQALSQSTPETASLDIPDFNVELSHGQEVIADNAVVVEPEGAESSEGIASTSTAVAVQSIIQATDSDGFDLLQSRTGWQNNPFLNQDSASEKTEDAVDANKSFIEISGVADLIQSNGKDSADHVSEVTRLEPGIEVVANPSLPAIDAQTLKSVVGSDDHNELDSPSMKLGLSQGDAQKAVHSIEYGKSLSRRGAAFAARQEFYSALRIMAQSHDKQLGNVRYTQALRNGIIALKEAEDFVVSDTESQIGLNVGNVIETHATKIISSNDAKKMTAIEAMQHYFAYASHQLARAGGQNVVAAECFYCLGKLHSVQAKLGASPAKLDVAKSLVFHQSAVLADPTNYRSLNELGVLYANSGRFEESKEMLKRSLRFHRLPQAWENLAVVHQRLGEHQLAELANREFKMISSRAPNSTIQWAGAEVFNQNAPLLQHSAAPANGVVPASHQTPGNSKAKSLGSRILDSIR